MMIRVRYILFISVLALCGCKEELNIGQESENAIELTGVRAEVVSSSLQTRADATPTTVCNLDYTSRFQFVSGDVMTFTKIQRTDNIIRRFQYRDVAFKNNASGAWERDKETGYNCEQDKDGNINTDSHPERIYWSDATSGHTFVGYSLPKDNTSFDWKKSAYYYEKDGDKCEFDTYYGAIGDPTNASEEIDYNPSSPTTESITTTVGNSEQTITIGYSQKLRNEDLLLTYDNDLKADNSVANIKFYHALSSVRVIVNISGFYGTEADAYSKVSDMVLMNQPTLYRWKQQSTAVDALLTENENTTLHQTELWGNGSNAPLYNQRKKMKLWNTKPEGEGSGASKTFTFYGITVPQDADYFTTFNGDEYKKLNMSFKVTYPDPLKNDPINKTITKEYQASLENPVKFYPGKCTTINITLNHKDETITVGASYQDWEFVETPDEGALKKKSTFLANAPELNQRSTVGVTIVGDEKATMDDATWLYEKKDNNGNTSLGIFDIYGNDGSSDSPYTISTAEQLLSFAYEVKSGRNFVGQYIKLDADITMQKSTSDSDVSWIGIGDATHPFDGFFFGNGRNINYLNGSSFFHTVGENAVIDKVNFAKVIKVTGSGVIAEVNNGLLCACNIEGDVEQAVQAGAVQSYCGSFVGNNQSFIIACTHVGQVAGYGYVGGLVGKNDGTIIASYHSGLVKFAGNATDPDASKKDDGWNVGGSTGQKGNTSVIFSCYLNSDNIDHTPDLLAARAAFPRTTSQMQSNAFVNSQQKLIDDTPITDGYQPFMSFANEHYSLNFAIAKFIMWLTAETASKTGDDWKIETTNGRSFNKQQVEWIKSHYGSHEEQKHKFEYVPGTYPKAY